MEANELLEIRRKERFTKGIILNIFLFAIFTGTIYFYVMPKYDSIAASVTETNTMRSYTDGLKNNGVDTQGFQDILAKSGRKKEVPDVIFTDAAKLNKVLKKPNTYKGNYLAWSADEAGKIDQINAEIAENDRILGNIIPNYSTITDPDSASTIKNQITFASFIDYIERQILQKYSLTSFSPLGINNISFSTDRATVVNIGSFKVSLDFDGKNSDILAFVNSLQQSGRLTIRDGKLVSTDSVSDSGSTTNLSSLSNLLVSIDSVTLNGFLANNDTKNAGSVTLEFYVEGMNYQKILILRSMLADDFTVLAKGVKENGALCTKGDNPICNEGVTNAAIATIKNLNSQVTALQKRFDDMKGNTVIADVNKEVDNLVAIRTSLQSIKVIYDRNMAIIDRFKTKK